MEPQRYSEAEPHGFHDRCDEDGQQPYGYRICRSTFLGRGRLDTENESYGL